jgi:hypothetical protein
MHGDFPADVVVKAGHLPRDEPRERDVVVKCLPLEIISAPLIRQTLFETIRIATIGGNAAASRGCTVEDFRTTVSRPRRLVVAGEARRAISVGLTERDNDTRRNIAEFIGLIRE